MLGRTLRGTARRREVHSESGLPREGSVSVFEVRLADGGWRLEVEAAWRGRPVGAPAVSDDSAPGVARETVGVGRDIELARGVARAGADDQRALRTPDVLATYARLRDR
jgi:hypothetical protein